MKAEEACMWRSILIDQLNNDYAIQANGVIQYVV